MLEYMLKQTLIALQILHQRSLNNTRDPNAERDQNDDVKMINTASVVYDDELDITYICEVGKVR